jgi:hypothetical protein
VIGWCAFPSHLVLIEGCAGRISARRFLRQEGEQPALGLAICERYLRPPRHGVCQHEIVYGR